VGRKSFASERNRSVELRLRLALTAAIVLAAPATLCAGAGLVHEVIGWPVDRPFEAAFAALGVTNSSPLPQRQAWYLGTYILAPLAGAAIAVSAAVATIVLRAAFIGVASVGTLIALYWVLHSLLAD
jgi:hypothetical protein